MISGPPTRDRDLGCGACADARRTLMVKSLHVFLLRGQQLAMEIEFDLDHFGAARRPEGVRGPCGAWGSAKRGFTTDSGNGPRIQSPLP